MDLTWHEWLVVIGAIVILGGYLFWRFKNEILFSFKAKETEGVITNWFKMHEKGKDFFYPLIDFNPENGNRISFRSDDRCPDQPMYPPGTKVRVRYLPTDPRQVKVTYPSKK